ncbi:MAG TPA: FecR family protein [Albitalea sp.]
MKRLVRISFWLGMALWAALVSGCGTPSRAPRAITLEGIVVDGRLARPDESGLVRINRDGAWIDARVPTTLRPGDWVMTGHSAQALIRYPSGSEVYMRSNTRGRVGSFSELVGEVFVKIRGLFAVQTTFVEAGAEGTAYSVRATQSGDYAVVVFDGTVRLSSLANAWPALTLPAGTMGAGRPQVPPRTQPAPPEEFARTRAWVEPMERLLPPPRSSSSLGPALAVAALVAIVAASASGSDDLAAPTGLTPAGATPQQAARPRSCRSLELAWRPVEGARDYVVTLQSLNAPARAAAAAAAAPATTRTTRSASLGMPAGLYGVYRWHVQARDARGKTSPASAPAHFYCPG